MRAGGCTVNQALTMQAAAVVKQAVVLAKRRGHAQVTPLHVATTMLAASEGIFRTACLQSHSHPLQCKALELCFNVALNRLPASSPGPMLGGGGGGSAHHSQPYPAISNALVAAFKRAQAHQRRGSIENQQQPLLAVKIELEQLIISILDDPSVSRVMKEAGFMSTQVKTNVEKTISSQNTLTSTNKPKENNQNNFLTLSPSLTANPDGSTLIKSVSSKLIKNEEVNTVIETLAKRRRKSVAIVGECITSLESIITEVMNRINRGNVDESLKEVKFISIPLDSFCNLHRETVELKIGELVSLVKSLVSKGVVLYLGDLKWITDYRSSCWGEERRFYCPVEHMIMEIGRLVYGIGEIGRFWLLGIATFQTFTRCKNGQFSLETLWGLYPVTVPANSLGLSLISISDKETDQEDGQNGGTHQQIHADGEEKLNCCSDCSAEFEQEARRLRPNKGPTLSNLPPWLRDESRRINSTNNNDQDGVSMGELCKKWNSICNSIHKNPKALERTSSFSSASHSPSTSCFSIDLQTPSLQKVPSFSRRAFSSNPNSTPTSASSSDVMDMDYVQRFKEFNAENLNFLCNALEEKVPSQKEIIPEITGSILQCRSGMLRRKDKKTADEVKQETWLFFLGFDDAQAKEKIAKELAKIIFGSYSNFISIQLSQFSSDLTDDHYRNKRMRDEQNSSHVDRLANAVSANPHRVFLVEDLDQTDYSSQIRVKRAIENGKISNENGEEVSLCDAIIILSCDSFSTRSRASSPCSNARQKSDGSLEMEEDDKSLSVSLDLNIGFDDHQIVEDNQSIDDDLGILDIVDRRIAFKNQN